RYFYSLSVSLLSHHIQLPEAEPVAQRKFIFSHLEAVGKRREESKHTNNQQHKDTQVDHGMTVVGDHFIAEDIGEYHRQIERAEYQRYQVVVQIHHPLNLQDGDHVAHIE